VRSLAVQVVHEPVEEWQKVPSGPKGQQTLNLLDKFYQDPQKYAYTFQNYVFMSRVMQVSHGSRQAKPHLASSVHLL
jgi:deoxyadenosine/deoxycytidine kinase